MPTVSCHIKQDFFTDLQQLQGQPPVFATLQPEPPLLPGIPGPVQCAGEHDPVALGVVVVLLLSHGIHLGGQEEGVLARVHHVLHGLREKGKIG